MKFNFSRFLQLTANSKINNLYWIAICKKTSEIFLLSQDSSETVTGNTHFSIRPGPANPQPAGPGQTTDPAVAAYLLAARARSTNRAYGLDLADFRSWGGAVPSTPDEVARYIAQRAATLRPSTLRRRLAALANAHHDIGAFDPTKHPLVRRVMQGIDRKHGISPGQVLPLLIDDLACIIAKMCRTRDDLRDRAILLVGFFGAFRRSELVALQVTDLHTSDAGVQITIRRSKTDQRGLGRSLFLARRTDSLCPVVALEDWLNAAPVKAGPVFPGSAAGPEMSSLSAQCVARIVKSRVSAIGLDPTLYSGHSLRAGFVTSSALAGIEGPLIARQTGHRSQQSLSAYVRPRDDLGAQLPTIVPTATA